VDNSGKYDNNPMLTGEYKHSIDAKRRLAVPAKFRRELGSGAIITKGLDNCLFVFSKKQWPEFAEKLGRMPLGLKDNRAFVRLFLASAVEVDFDGLGRILLPDTLRGYASLKKEAVITGVFNRLEIWDEKIWNTYRDNLEKNSDKIAEKLGELGII